MNTQLYKNIFIKNIILLGTFVVLNFLKVFFLPDDCLTLAETR